MHTCISFAFQSDGEMSDYGDEDVTIEYDQDPNSELESEEEFQEVSSWALVYQLGVSIINLCHQLKSLRIVKLMHQTHVHVF